MNPQRAVKIRPQRGVVRLGLGAKLRNVRPGRRVILDGLAHGRRNGFGLSIGNPGRPQFLRRGQRIEFSGRHGCIPLKHRGRAPSTQPRSPLPGGAATCQTAGMIIDLAGFVSLAALMFGLFRQLRQDIAKQGERLEKKIDQYGKQLSEKIDRQGEQLNEKIDRQSDRFDSEIAKLHREMVKQGDRLEEQIVHLRQEMSQQDERLDDRQSERLNREIDKLRGEMAAQGDRAEEQTAKLSKDIAEQGERLSGEISKLSWETAKQGERLNALERGQTDFRERMAKLEGLLEGLREAISGRRAA